MKAFEHVAMIIAGSLYWLGRIYWVLIFGEKQS